MARRKKQQAETKQEIKEEVVINKEEAVEEKTSEKQPAKEDKDTKIQEAKEVKPPKNLNEYIQVRLAEQEAALASIPKSRAVATRDAKGNVKISIENTGLPPVKKGRMLRNTIVSNSYTGWQRTLLAGTVVEIVNEFGNKVTVKAYGMLHTVAAKYIEKL